MSVLLFIISFYVIVDEYYAILVNDDDDEGDELNISDLIDPMNCPNDEKGSTPLEFILSKRSHPQLVHDGYSFNCERVMKFKKVWRCSQSHKTKCRARIATVNSELIVVNPHHNHPKVL